MKVVLLSAGLGKRFLPFTENEPKSLYEVAGKPLIVWNLEKLRNYGFNEVVINLFHLGNRLKDYLGDGSKIGLKITYSEEKTLLGTGGGIGKAINLLDKNPFLVLSCDIWTNFDFSQLWLPKKSLAHMVLVPNPKSNMAGDVNLNGDLVQSEGYEKKYTFSGICVLDPRIFSFSFPKKYQLWERILLPASRKGLVTGELFKGELFNINTIKDAERLDAFLGQE